LNTLNGVKEVRGYCGNCEAGCPTVAYAKDGVFIEVKPDKEHHWGIDLCPKGLAGPELVHSQHRLQYPMRRTNPKGSPDPGWERISWDEALDIIAIKLNEIKDKYGAEAVAFTRAGPGGSPMGEMWPWIMRLSKAFGSPNNIGTINICTWHTMFCSGYTYAGTGAPGSAGNAEYERSRCILIWGNNVHSTCQHLVPRIKKGLEQGAKLIVIDPRNVEIAQMADLWLQLLPGTDGALALGMINVMLEDNLFNHDFVRDWTTAPFLVKSGNGEFLMGNELTGGGDPASYVMVNAANREPMVCVPGTETTLRPAIYGTYNIKTRYGQEIECKTVFELLRDAVSGYNLQSVETITRVPEEKIREAARMFATIRPACWYGWNGIEQSSNSSQTNRAICILYALTGNYDMPGGNVLPRTGLHTRAIDGHWFLSPEASEKALGLDKFPLGPGGWRMSSTPQGYEVYEAILNDKPYPVKALVSFGGNLATSNSPVLKGKEALLKLDFHVQAELFMTRTAELADIVLPAASFWESDYVKVFHDTVGGKALVQMRPAVVSPQHESWPDMKIIFQLAKRLGMGDKFWDGDYEAGFNYQYSPLGITIEKLRKSPAGIPFDVSMQYQKYGKKDDTGKYRGFPTPSKRIELYSLIFKKYGYDPLPTWSEPSIFTKPGVKERYPLIFMNVKIKEYCQSQHRSLPSLRKKVPHPFLEINPRKASELDIKDGEYVIVETPYGSITLQARLTDEILYDVVCTQNGWWQSCPELNLPGYDPYSSEGANVAFLFSPENRDPISGALLLKGHPCNVRKANN
jgi:anaerobic selenocysteine-containing dehydrogenase